MHSEQFILAQNKHIIEQIEQKKYKQKDISAWYFPYSY